MAYTFSGALCIRAHQQEEWNDWIDRVPHDLYHRAEYHRLMEDEGEGVAYLAIFGDREHFIAWPYLLVPLTTVPGLPRTELCDVTSVYGYPGPLSRGCNAGSHFLQDATGAIRELWQEQKVVSAFTRTNPFLRNVSLLDNFGELVPAGQTVSMDLEISLEQSWAEYRRSHRYEIRKGREAGLRAYNDERWQYLDEFVRLYAETMRCKGAAKCYLFGETYFTPLRERLGNRCHLFVALQGDDVAAGALLLESSGIVQYHLSATHPDYRHAAPTKVLLDEARIWAKSRRNKVLHLGGGVGGVEDSLFSFKAGFSNRRHPFFVWRAVLDQANHDSLAAQHAEFRSKHGLVPESEGFFPAYRQPVLARGRDCRETAKRK